MHFYFILKSSYPFVFLVITPTWNVEICHKPMSTTTSFMLQQVIFIYILTLIKISTKSSIYCIRKSRKWWTDDRLNIHALIQKWILRFLHHGLKFRQNVIQKWVHIKSQTTIYDGSDNCWLYTYTLFSTHKCNDS